MFATLYLKYLNQTGNPNLAHAMAREQLEHIRLSMSRK